MHHQRMRVVGAARLAILPRLPAIQAPQQRTGLDGGEEAPGHQWVGRDPAHMARIWSGRKAPRRGRGQLAQRAKLPPRAAAVF
ncbi:MAG: hypothetical protein E6I80_06550 [Chloroflexi bacterium]|nr:MAG: hypothetical protein E6I80_06550 [Chloroflexota bacterium]